MDTTDLHTTNCWRKEEQEILRENYATLGAKAISELLPGRSVSAIYGQAFLLDLKRIIPRKIKPERQARIPKETTPEDPKVDHRWKEHEDDVIRKYYAQGGAIAVRERLPHRTLDAIKYRASNLGVPSRIAWTQNEINILKEFCCYTIIELKMLLPRRSRVEIIDMAESFGLSVNTAEEEE